MEQGERLAPEAHDRVLAGRDVLADGDLDGELCASKNAPGATVRFPVMVITAPGTTSQKPVMIRLA